MKAVFTAEAIGFGESVRQRGREPFSGARRLDARRPWCAELVGLVGIEGNGEYRRSYLKPKIDYRDMGRSGNRNVYFCWTLDAGQLYQARYRVTWSRWEGRLMTVTEAGEIRDVTEEEVRGWLANVA